MAKADRARKPTRAEKEVMSNNDLVADNWLVTKDLGAYLQVVNKTSGKVRNIDKYKKGKKR